MPPELRRRTLPLVALLLLALPAGAVEHEVAVYLDLDDDATTGCEVATVAGTFSGAEQVLVATVETSASPSLGAVAGLAAADCLGAPGGTFGPTEAIDGGWPLGVATGEAGRDVVELYAPLAALAVEDPARVRLGVVIGDELGGERALLTVDGAPGGPPIVLPLLSPAEIPALSTWGALALAVLLAVFALRALPRRAAAAALLALAAGWAGVAWAAVALDGLPDDWLPGDRLAAGATVLFARGEADALWFRVDADLLFSRPPTITAVPDQTIAEDGAIAPLAFVVGDPESPPGALTVTAISSRPSLVPAAALALTGTGAARAVAVTPVANGFGTADVTLAVTDPDGGVASTTFRVTVTPVNDPPTVTSSTISYAAVGNTLLLVPGDDAAHDGGAPGRVASTRDPENAFAKAGVADVDSPVGFQPGAFATAAGGRLVLDDDGDFHYTPPIGFTGADEAAVVVTDAESATVPVTLEIAVADVVWYVEDTTGGGNPPGDADGRSTDAFETLGAAEAASGPGDWILLFETTGALDESIRLQSGQRLYGQPVAAAAPELLPAGLVLEPIDDTGALPAIGPAVGDAVTVAATAGSLLGVEVRHLALSGAGNAVDVTSSGAFAVEVTIADNLVAGSGAEGIDLEPGSSGAFTARVTDNAFSPSGVAGPAVDVTTAAGNAAAAAVAIERNVGLAASSAAALHLDGGAGTGTLVVTGFADNTVDGGTAADGVVARDVVFDADPADADFDPVAAGTWRVGDGADPVGGAGVVLGAPGAPALGDLAFARLDVFAGTGGGLEVNGGGAFGGGSHGTGLRLATADGRVEATGGRGLTVATATLEATLAAVVASASPLASLEIGDSTGFLVAGPGSSLVGSAGAVFLHGALPLDFTYSGTIANDTAGHVAFVQGLPAGSEVLFDGPSLTAQGGHGIEARGFGGVLTVAAAATTLTECLSGFVGVGTTGTVHLVDVTMIDPRNALDVRQSRGSFDFDNVDVQQDSVGILFLARLNLETSVDFDAESELVATGGVGIRVEGNVGPNSFTFRGPVDLGTAESPLDTSGVALELGRLQFNSAATATTFADLDIVLASGRGAILKVDFSTLNVTTGTVRATNHVRSWAINLAMGTSNIHFREVDIATTHPLPFGGGIRCEGEAGTKVFDSVKVSVPATAFLMNQAGTVSVTGGGNTIDASGGPGVVIVDTAIGAEGVTFERVSVDNASNAVRLANTGTLGSFTITGDGGSAANGSGGTMANLTGAAIDLADTRGVSVEQIAVSDVAGHGVVGARVDGLAVRHSTFTDIGVRAGEDVFSFDRGGLGDDGLVGAATFADLTVNGFAERVLDLVNEGGGALDLDVDGLAATGADPAFGAQALRVETAGAGQADVTVTGLAATDAGGVAIVGAASSATTFDLRANRVTGARGPALLVGARPAPGRTVTLDGTVGGAAAGDGNLLASDDGDGIVLDLVGDPGGGSTIGGTIVIGHNTVEFEEDGLDVLHDDAAGSLGLVLRENGLAGVAGDDGSTADLGDGIVLRSRDGSVGAASRLAVEAADNVVDGVAAANAVFAVEADEPDRVCLSLTGTRVGSGAGGIRLAPESAAALLVTAADAAALSAANGGLPVTEIVAPSYAPDGDCAP